VQIPEINVDVPEIVLPEIQPQGPHVASSFKSLPPLLMHYVRVNVQIPARTAPEIRVQIPKLVHRPVSSLFYYVCSCAFSVWADGPLGTAESP